ncbi:RagB/SusD family nutrient uptake outer membrane protein [Flavivirga abyssicola]|uniref:RagB/SusD family nutrient uptake outer membrane protein n=1 Tax=Flavivirga abyssicola TaxID=3063533 RepID=UPI0026DFFBCA|nr:RagB/SusD family nutrient uptake outer membrane protein [Flavivirga sp. MEBiC07777]WVK15264.1 RagB/SusD family nutrient uptake outer membrane protein [Flavivirga sp. MEBiC07777]
MKKIYNILLVVIFIVNLSCEDAIDIVQPGELSEEVAFANVNDLQIGLNAVYFGLNTDNAIEISSFFTDETALGVENSGQNLDLLRFQLNTVSGIPENMWLGNYATINSVNRILRAANTISVNTDEQDTYNDILGQLYAIRAAEHFELLTYFSTDLKDDSALGVIKLDIVPAFDTYLPRVSNGELFQFIESDLSLAKSLLDNNRSNVEFITSNFIKALEARIALYRGDNDAALTLAQELIDDIPLATRTQYQSLFRDISTDGLIFKGERNQSNNTDGIPSLYYFRFAGITGGPFMEISRSLFNNLNPDDIRYDVIVQSSSQIDPGYESNKGKNDILLIGKYQGHDGQPLLNDYKYFRVAEMYLIKAEAQAMLNDLDGAATTLKELRDARFSAPTSLDSYASQTEALIAVLDERRIELAFEGHRYIDLKRLSNITGTSIDRDAIDCESFNACELGVDEFFKFTFPIPQRELAGNPEIRSQQNPGYN